MGTTVEMKNKQRSGKRCGKKKMHLLVVVAERVRDAQFGNIHQSTLSIPGVAIKKTDKQTAGEKLEEEISS